MTTIRKGQARAPLTRAEFHERFATRFYDPAFAVEADAIARLEDIAWDALQEGRKAPITRKAGRGFADPGYEVSVQWLDTRQRLKAAEKRWHQATEGVEVHRRNLCDWLEWMGLIDAGAAAKLDRYIGYYEPHYNSHDTLDKDAAVQEVRARRLSQPDKQIKWPRPK